MSKSDDNITGTGGDDTISSGAGTNTVDGGAGDDVIGSSDCTDDAISAYDPRNCGLAFGGNTTIAIDLAASEVDEMVGIGLLKTDNATSHFGGATLCQSISLLTGPGSFFADPMGRRWAATERLACENWR